MNKKDLEYLKNTAFRLKANTRGVYLLFYDDELVYIGKGWNCFLRVAEHTRKDSNKQFNSWNFIPVPETKDLDHFEKLLIQEHKPKYNVQHKR